MKHVQKFKKSYDNRLAPLRGNTHLRFQKKKVIIIFVEFHAILENFNRTTISNMKWSLRHSLKSIAPAELLGQYRTLDSNP